MKIKLF